MRNILFDFGIWNIFGHWVPVRIYSYGLMMVLGFLLGIAQAQWRAMRNGESAELIARCGFLALVAGVIGARLAFVIQQAIQHPDPVDPQHIRSVADAMNVTSGGLIYYGGVILATAAVIGYLAIKRLPMRRYLDMIAPSLMIGLAFGRCGCFLNGCCYGGPANENSALSIRFPMYAQPLFKLDGSPGPFSSGNDSLTPVYAHQLEDKAAYPGFHAPAALLDRNGDPLVPSNMSPEQMKIAAQEKSLPVKPAQPLAIINALLIAGILMFFHRQRRWEGQVFALLAILYPIMRFIEEAIRDDNPHKLAGGFFGTHNQYTSLAMLAGGVALWLVIRYLLPASAGPTLAQREADAA
jgi:phosphatidylglycerol:prolipoprotein diacylglycerol transferase